MTQGERIFIYTDVVNEATDKNNQLYCENHHLETVYRKNVKKPQKLCRAVNNDVNAFVGEASQFDYITMEHRIKLAEKMQRENRGFYNKYVAKRKKYEKLLEKENPKLYEYIMDHRRKQYEILKKSKPEIADSIDMWTK